MLNEIISILSIFLPSFLTRVLFRLVGHKIGKNAKISIFSYIYGDKIEIGNDVDVRAFVYIRVGKLEIGKNSIISFGTQIKGNKNFITKGNNFIGAHCLINCEEDVKMGFYSGLGPRCTVYTHGSFLPITKGYPAKFEKIVLEDYVWIAMEVTILPGTYIESNCIVNPGVVLKSRIKANSLIELNPNVISEKNLSRLQIFLSKKNQDYLKQIISQFLKYYNLEYWHHEEDNYFLVEKKYIFKYLSEADLIELSVDKATKITYDLKEFSAGVSNLKIHKKFLFYLRRRWGIILQTKYDEDL